MKWFETNKYDFQRYLRQVKADSYSFRYIDNGNDVWNPCGTLQRQAIYEFRVIAGGYIKTIVYKQHRRSHHEVREQLTEKYSRWAEQVLKQNKINN